MNHEHSWAIDAMDEMRKESWRIAHAEDKSQLQRKRGRTAKEGKLSHSAPGIKRSKYALGKNLENTTETQKSCLDEIRKHYPKLFKGYQLKEGVRRVFQCSKETVSQELLKWLSWSSRCRIPVFAALSKKIRRHMKAIISTVKHNLSNARLESMNSKIKVLIHKSYGFRNRQNMMDMIMIVCSNLSKRIQMPHATRKCGI